MFASQDELEFTWDRMFNIELNSFRSLISKLVETNSSLLFNTITVIDVSPNTFNISIRNILNNVPLIF
jgi:hypothetical protein